MAIDLQEALETLRRTTLDMCGLVEQRVDKVVRALAQDDLTLAREVREGDRDVDTMDVDIEKQCLEILALSHPVAGDLRFVLAVLRMNNALERIGDEAKSLAKRVMHLREDGAPTVPEVILSMARSTRAMLRDAVESFARQDAAQARQVRLDDQRVDDLQKEAFSWATSQIPRHVEQTGSAIDYLSIARRLERIADLSTNLAEEVIFLVKGEVVRHKGE